MDNLFLIIIILSWLLGLLFILLSNPTRIISKINYPEIITNKPYYSIKHIRKAVTFTHNEEIIQKLKHKIIFRKIGYMLLALCLFLVVINGVIK